MKDLACKLSLESAAELDGKAIVDSETKADLGPSYVEALLEQHRDLLVEIVNEVRAIRAHHCHLPWPETLVELEAKANAGAPGEEGNGK